MKFFLSILTALLLTAATASASGYALYEGSARGNVAAARLIAEGGEPGTLYFNPAAITALPGTQVQMGVSAVMPFGSVSTVNPYTGQHQTTDGSDKVWPIPSAYLTHQINDSLWFGLGIFSRFGLGSKLPADWPGRYNSYKAYIESADFVPTIAWKINDSLSVSAGLIVRYFDIELAQKIDVAGAAGLRNPNDPSPSPYDIDQNLHGDDINAGLALGLQFKPTQSLSLGAAYHSRLRFVCKGDADWTKPAAVNALLPDAFNDTRWDAKNYNPDEIMLGAAWHATEKWTLSASAIYTLWSIYDDLVIHFDTPALMGHDTISTSKEWDDVWRLSAGAAYDLNPAWTLSASYTFDQSPLNPSLVDYMVPADDRHMFALGATWTKNTWTFDASYIYEIIADMTIDGRIQNGVLDGEFLDATAHILAASLTKRF